MMSTTICWEKSTISLHRHLQRQWNHPGGRRHDVGMDWFDVRRKIMEDLKAAGLVEKVEDYVNKVGHRSVPTL